MHPLEMNAYRMTLRNGTLSQIRRTLFAICDLEPRVPDELLTDVVGTLQRLGGDAVRELAWPIHRLLGKTHSMELYRVADELTYLNIDRSQVRVCLNGKVNLFAIERFYHPDVEQLVIDELYQWINYLGYIVRQPYLDDLPPELSDGPQYNMGLKVSEFFSSPFWPIGRILTALEQVGTPHSHESLLAMQYLFRPRLNNYLVIAQRRVNDGDQRAIESLRHAQDVESAITGAVPMLLTIPSVYSLRDVLDRVASLSRFEPPAVSFSPVPFS
ncbi:MAG: hypothetical protein K8T26_11420 [Lentisphaerae bacterium]|nr:hypothetical protein [Lentisphaerota bacterium]